MGQGVPTAQTAANAIVQAVTTAKAKLALARVGYGTTSIDLNVNRDLFNRKLEWRQEPNPTGPSDKTLAPGYRDGPDVTLRVGLVRLGDIHLVTVNGEVYSQIGMRLKAESPASKTMMVTLANGSAGSGYIYSDEAYSHLTFQVIG